MLKRKALNRIFITTIAFFIVFTFSSLNFIDNKKNIYGMNNYKTNYKESIYTLNKDNYVSKAYIYVDKELSSLEKVKILMETMIKNNNKNALLPSYFKPILPSNTKIIDVILDGKIIKINFSKELLNITEEQSEQMIESIVYTLTDINDINGVEIYVEGELLKFVPHSKKTLETILTKDIGINKKYDIISNKEINKVILYFLGSENNYIPVTSYVNDNREKIEIIIETLTNKYIFYDNLISSLNSDIVFESYEIKDNTCYINVKNLSNDKDVSLVVYSIFANYDVENIVFLENNNKILEKNKKNLE